VKRFDVVTIFPGMLDALVDHGITRRAMDEGRFELKAWDPRDFTHDGYRRVDDRPYGGGPGMVMLPGPLEACIEAAKARQKDAGVAKPVVVLMSPQGERLEERVAWSSSQAATKASTNGWWKRWSIARCRSATTSPRGESSPRW
jgi:tRNA (guanine37-N1)-methyltransferase